MNGLAIVEFEQFLKLYPEDDNAGSAARRLADLYASDSSFTAARAAYHRAAVLSHDTTAVVEALRHAARMDLILRDTSRAVETLLAIPVLYPQVEALPRVMVDAGRLLVDAGRFVEAERRLDGMLREFPGTPWERQARLLLARAYAGQGDYPPAIQQARGVAELTQSDSLRLEAGVWIGRWELERGDADAAEQILSLVLEGMGDVPGVETAALALGQQRGRFGDRDGGREMLHRVLAGRPAPDQARVARVGLGDLHFEAGQYDSALAVYVDLPDSATGLRRGWSAEYLGRLDQARDAYQGALVDTGLAAISARLQLADLLLRSTPGERDEIAGEIELPEAALVDTAAGDTVSIATQTRRVSTDSPAPETLLLEAVELASADGSLDAVRIRAADLLRRHRDSKTALTFLQRTTPLTPARSLLSDDLLWLLAELLVDASRFDQAAREYAAFADRYPASPRADEARRRARVYGDRLPADEVQKRLADLFTRMTVSPGDPALVVESARLYLEALDRPDQAFAQLEPLFDRNELPDTLARQARELAGDALWRIWERSSSELRLSSRSSAADSLAALAGRMEGAWLDIAATDSTTDDNPEAAWRLLRWQIARERSLPAQVRLERQLYQDYLTRFPSSSHAAETRLALARALSTTLAGEDAAAHDSTIAALLGELRRQGPASGRSKALAGLLELERRQGDQDAVNPLTRELLTGDPSPEQVDAALELLRNDPRSELTDEALAALWPGDVHPYRAELVRELPLLVNAMLEQGRVDRARGLFYEARLATPTDPATVYPQFLTGDGLYARARLEEAGGDTLAALADYHSLITESPNSAWAGEAMVRLGRLYDRLGHDEQALAWYQRALDRDSSGDELLQVRRRMARWAFEGEQYEQAREWALQAATASQDPDSQLVMQELAIVSLYPQGNLQQARREAEAFADRWDGNNPLRNAALARFALEKGRWLSSRKQYDDAMDAYKDVVRRYEDTVYPPYARYEMARDYLEQGEAEKSYEMLIELSNDATEHPVMGEVFWLLGNHYANTGSYSDAFRQYEKVLADTTYRVLWPHVLGNQIRAYKEAGFYEGSLRAARRFLELYPEHEDAFDHRMNLALAYHELGQYDLAIAQFRRAMIFADNEDYAASQFYIAEALEKAGRLQEAVGAYLRVVHLNRPTKLKWGVTALYNAGRVLERLGQPDRARGLYEEIVAREGLGSPFGRKAQEQVDRIEDFDQ